MPALTGPFTIVLLLCAIAFFAWTFWDLFGELRDGESRIQGAPRREWRWGGKPGATRASERFRDYRTYRNAEAPPRGREPGGEGRESLHFSKTLETWIDRATGEMRGRSLQGPFRGRGLETLSRAECVKLHEYCVLADAEAARLLGTYLDRRFGVGWRPRSGAGQGGPRARFEGPMTRQQAFEALGLASGASEKEIVRAHRALIKKHHPDHGGSTADAAVINQAKDMLLDKRG